MGKTLTLPPAQQTPPPFALKAPRPPKYTDGVLVPHSFVSQIEVKRTADAIQVAEVEQFYVCRDAEVDHFFQWAAGQRCMGYDTETSGISVYDHLVATIQFGNPKHPVPRTYTIDWRCLSEASRDRFRRYLEDPSVKKLGQNVKFECVYAIHRLGARIRNVACTQVAELAIRAGLFPTAKYAVAEGDESKRLAYAMCSMEKLMKRYRGVQINKDIHIRTSFYATPPGCHCDEQILYAGDDVVYPWFLAEDQQQEIVARELRAILKIEFELIPVLAESELRGVYIDQVAWNVLYQDALKMKDAAQQNLDRMFLGKQGDLFGGGFDVAERNCPTCLGSGSIFGADCPKCRGERVVRRQEVRPQYLGGRSKNKKPEPLNWGSSTQLRWAIKRYCQSINWSHEVLLTPTEVLKVKRRWGAQWCEKRGLDPAKITNHLDIPDYVIPEDRYCVLLDANAKLTLPLRMIRGQLPKEFMEAVLDFTAMKSFTSTFGADFLKKHTKADGRIHTEFHQLIAATGRMSTEPNLQNIPRLPKYRKCFMPAPGYVFVIADYASIEPRISAQVSKDQVYCETFAKLKGDLYIEVGQRLFGREIDKKTPQGSEDRQAAKVVVLGLAYRMGPGKLRDALTLQLKRPIDFAWAAELHKKFLEECSGITAFQELCSSLADPKSPKAQKLWDSMLNAEVTYITSPCGRHRFFPPDANNTYTESANHPIQACSATITKAAAVMIQQHIDAHNVDAYGVNYVHDEIVYECRADQAHEFKLVVKDLMERAGQFYVPDVKVIAEFPEGSDGTVPWWTKEIHLEAA